MSLSVFILLVLLFLSNILFKIYIYRKNRKRKKSNSEPFSYRQSLLRRLKRIHRFDAGGYKGITKEKIVSLIKKIEELDELIILEEDESKWKAYEEKVKLLEEETKAFSETLISSIRRWDEIEKAIEENIEFSRHFFDHNNFYPTDFTHDANRLQRKLNDLVDEKRENPLGNWEEFKNYNDEFKSNFDTYLILHENVSRLIVCYDEIKDSFKEPIKNEVHDLKQSIFFDLQNAKLKDAEKKIKQFNQLIDKIK